jgi:hypothetical protein
MQEKSSKILYCQGTKQFGKHYPERVLKRLGEVRFMTERINGHRRETSSLSCAHSRLTKPTTHRSSEIRTIGTMPSGIVPIFPAFGQPWARRALALLTVRASVNAGYEEGGEAEKDSD